MIRYSRKRQQGATLIEASMVLGVVLMVVLTTLEGGRLIYSYQSVVHLAQQGARYAAVRGSTAGTDTLRAGDAPVSTTSLSTYLNSIAPVSGITVTTAFSQNSNGENDLSSGQPLTVGVSYRFTPVIPFLPTMDIYSDATSVIYY